MNSMLENAVIIKVEVPATPEGYAFVERKLGDFKLEDVPQQEFVNSLKME